MTRSSIIIVEILLKWAFRNSSVDGSTHTQRKIQKKFKTSNFLKGTLFISEGSLKKKIWKIYLQNIWFDLEHIESL